MFQERYGKLYAHKLDYLSTKDTKSELLSSVQFGTAGQMAYDWVNDNLYLVDTLLNRILIVSGTQYEHSSTILTHDVEVPHAIAVDPLERYQKQKHNFISYQHCFKPNACPDVQGFGKFNFNRFFFQNIEFHMMYDVSS